MKKLHIRLGGEVHGVGFRNFVMRRARDLAISGWVRNRSDDTVEIEAIGAQSPLEDFLEAVKIGPPHSIVAELNHEFEDYEKTPSGKFKILETL